MILSTSIALWLGSAQRTFAQATAEDPASQPVAAPPPGPQDATVPAPPPGYSAQPAQYADPYRPAPGQPYIQAGVRPGDPLPGEYRPRPRLSRGMMIGGIIMLGLSYLPGMLTGAIMLDARESRFQEIGAYLLIPVLGPFLALGPAEHAKSVLALYGVVQLSGAILMVAGIMKFRNSKRVYREQAGLAVWELGEKRTLALDLATSPSKLGPQLALRF